MKKTVMAILICGVMIFSVAGCVKKEQGTNSNNNETESTDTQELEQNTETETSLSDIGIEVDDNYAD